MELYPLFHIHEILEGGDERNVKLLGVFTSRKKVYQAIKRYKELPGFNEKQAVFYGDDYGEGFSSSKLTPGISYWDGGYTTMEDFAASYAITIVHDEDDAEEASELLIDVPYYMQVEKLKTAESSVEFLQSLLDEHHKTKNYSTGPFTELYQLKKLIAHASSKL